MTKKRLLLLIIITLLVGLLGWQNVIELRAEEPRRAIVSIEMLLSGDYTHLQINGEHYYNKPPIFNIILAFFYKIFSSFSEWVVRLPSLISFLITGIVVYLFGKRHLDKQTALYTTLFYLTAGDILFYGTVNSGEIDLFYSLVTILQAMAIFHYQQKGNYWKLFIISYLIATVGLLTKGLSTLPFQAFTILGWLIYTRTWKKIFSLQHLAGITIMAAITVGYFMLYDNAGDAKGYIINLINESTHKTAQQNPIGKTIMSFVVFPFNFIKLVMPWALLIVFTFRKGFKQKLKEYPLLAFSLIFILANIWLYWISPGTANRYLYMFFPFLFYIIAKFYVDHSEGDKKKKIIEGIFMGIIAIVGIAFIAIPFIGELNSINNRWAITLFLVISSAAIFYAYLKLKAHRILVMVLFLGLVRIATNLTVAPATQANSSSLIYRDAISEMARHMGDERVYFYGQPYKYHVQAKLGGYVFDETDLTVPPPFIPYQLFYYLSRHNSKICIFTDKLEKGKFYISKEIWVPKDIEISVLSSFTEAIHQEKVILFRLAEN